jgi:hypothetical protein
LPQYRLAGEALDHAEEPHRLDGVMPAHAAAIVARFAAPGKPRKLVVLEVRAAYISRVSARRRDGLRKSRKGGVRETHDLVPVLHR